MKTVKYVMRQVAETAYACERCRKVFDIRRLQTLTHFYVVEDHGRTRDYDEEIHLCNECVNALTEIWHRRLHEASQPEKEYL